MIEIRKQNPDETPAILALLKRNACDKFSDYVLKATCFVVVESGCIHGVCGIIENESVPIIDFILVDSNQRGLQFGDGLLRAALNYLDHTRHPLVYVKSNSNTKAFFEKENLVPRDTLDPDPDFSFFEVHLLDFFNTPCKGSR